MPKKKSEEFLPGCALAEAPKKTEKEVIDALSTAPEEVEDVESPPPMTSPLWSDYVVSQFDETELINERPTVGGLRRVAELLLGPIIESNTGVPALHNILLPDGRNTNYWVVSHQVAIQFTEDQTVRRFTAVGNVNGQNVLPEWLRWGPETASKRAEARALQSALKLQKVYSAEEDAPAQEDLEVSDKDPITPTQVNYLKLLSERNGIDLDKYINYDFVLNAVVEKYKSVEDITNLVAKKMITYLSECQREQSKIKEGFKKCVE